MYVRVLTDLLVGRCPPVDHCVRADFVLMSSFFGGGDKNTPKKAAGGGGGGGAGGGGGGGGGSGAVTDEEFTRLQQELIQLKGTAPALPGRDRAARSGLID